MASGLVDLTHASAGGLKDSGPELRYVRRRLDELVEERWLCGLNDIEEWQYRELARREEQLLHSESVPA